ncbi:MULTISPECIES: GspH/FimT family pseudopilin [Aliivibrio]|uniref:Type II secretion system protein H n=1 Tax=Aliivibrio logei TaxID=688 RepID=A0A1B9NYT1_ALILO|nr:MULTISPECIES: GspH/FimT family pseudopilin [Aliivibrio]MBB1312634.1 GspH/FimT family pseudopilin [Aliivibrio sp. SR45-2]OCH20967.1 type IV pilin [Aliivibrio logei]
MNRGFTLLELLITITVLAILLSVAAPNFNTVNNSVKMQRLATELNGFLIQAKSEAVLRNSNLWVHISFPKTEENKTGSWNLALRDSDNISGNLIAYMGGNNFNKTTLQHNYDSQKINFEGIRGRPARGTFIFYPNNDMTKKLKIILSNPPGRIKVCYDNTSGELYGYNSCS